MPEGENRNPILVDTKTRVQDTRPAEPQRRNGRYAKCSLVVAVSFNMYMLWSYKMEEYL